MFLDDTPNNNQPGIAEILSSERACDLCATKHDLIDMIPCPEGGGYYCADCIKDGDVESYLRRKHKYDQVKIYNFLSRIKL